jgi:hypothetical protein
MLQNRVLSEFTGKSGGGGGKEWVNAEELAAGLRALHLNVAHTASVVPMMEMVSCEERHLSRLQFYVHFLDIDASVAGDLVVASSGVGGGGGIAAGVDAHSRTKARLHTSSHAKNRVVVVSGQSTPTNVAFSREGVRNQRSASPKPRKSSQKKPAAQTAAMDTSGRHDKVNMELSR